jgi:hypothetical protein
MRRIITSTLLLASLITGGTALADRRGGHEGHGRVVVHETYRGRPAVQGGVRVERPVYRGTVRHDRHVIQRRPIYVNNGGYVFGSRVVRYNRPVIRERYYNVRIRPQVVVENYPNQDGYVWTQGQWAWDGREWQWQSGHYEVDARYNNYYDDGSWD